MFTSGQSSSPFASHCHSEACPVACFYFPSCESAILPSRSGTGLPADFDQASLPPQAPQFNLGKAQSSPAKTQRSPALVLSHHSCPSTALPPTSWPFLTHKGGQSLCITVCFPPFLNHFSDTAQAMVHGTTRGQLGETPGMISQVLRVRWQTGMSHECLALFSNSQYGQAASMVLHVQTRRQPGRK
jgi:hypothetical protein